MLAAGDMVSRYQAGCLIPAGATDTYWDVKILDSSPSYFNFSSETTSNMASKMLAIELWVVRQFNLEIFCLNVYGDNDETMILYQWNELQ